MPLLSDIWKWFTPKIVKKNAFTFSECTVLLDPVYRYFFLPPTCIREQKWHHIIYRSWSHVRQTTISSYSPFQNGGQSANELRVHHVAFNNVLKRYIAQISRTWGARRHASAAPLCLLNLHPPGIESHSPWTLQRYIYRAVPRSRTSGRGQPGGVGLPSSGGTDASARLLPQPPSPSTAKDAIDCMNSVQIVQSVYSSDRNIWRHKNKAGTRTAQPTQTHFLNPWPWTLTFETYSRSHIRLS